MKSFIIEKAKVAFSMILAASLCLSVCCSRAAATNQQDFVSPNWFDAGSDNNWYNWDWQHGLAGDRFSVTHEANGAWTCTVNYDWALDVTNPYGAYSVDTAV